MKVALISAILLVSATAYAGQNQDTRKLPNAEQEMRKRDNNASVLIGTGAKYEYPGEDTRPQGKKANKDFSDLDVKKKK